MAASDKRMQQMIARILHSGRTALGSLAQAVSRLSSDGMSKEGKRNPLHSNKPMLASTSATALSTMNLRQQEQVDQGDGFLSSRPSWVKEPSATSLALAQEIAKNASVGWSGFIRPVDRAWEMSSKFGPRWGRHHNGVDLAAPTGEPVLAADSGEVTYAGWEPGGYGYLVEITHSDGWKTLYAHNSEIFTWEGQQVKRGECIACVGETGKATGPHLHWEIRNKFGHPVDPSEHVDL